MKNVINYYYNLYPDNIFQSDKGYYFYIDDIKYYFVKYEYDDLEKIYNLHLNMLNSNFYIHPIVVNRDNSIYTAVDSNKYVLVKIIYYSDVIDLNSVLSFFSYPASLAEINWHELWSKKNDYIRYQINMLGKKYKILRESIDYYIGLGENAIQLMSMVRERVPLYYVHKRILDDLYNPLNICLDSKVRDIAEYLKQCFFMGNDISYDIDYVLNSYLNDDEYVLFLARMLYPTYYYDLFEKIILGEKDEEEIIKIVDRSSNFEMIIKKIYMRYKSFMNIPVIEWLSN